MIFFFNLPDLPAGVRAQSDQSDSAAPAHSLHLHLCSAAVRALKSIALNLASHDCEIVSQQFILLAFCGRSRAAPLPHHPSLHRNQSLSDTDGVLALTEGKKIIVFN